MTTSALPILPDDTPVMTVDAATARSVAAGDIFAVADLASTVEADFASAVAKLDADPAVRVAYVLIKVTSV